MELEEAGVQLVYACTHDNEKVGAVARLGERRRDPAHTLQDSEVAELGFAEGVIDDAAGAIGERQRRAHALDVGAEPAIERQLRLADQGRGRFDGVGERRILAPHLGTCRRKLALEAGGRPGAAILQHLQPVAVTLDLEIVAEHPAKRAGHVLEQFGLGALAAGLARGKIRHEADP